VPKARLTQLGLQNLQPPQKGQVDVWDTALPAFGVRVSQGGSKTFILKLDNSRRAIGRYPILSLSEARTEAKRLLAEKTLGKIRPQSITFPEARDLFVAEKERSRKPGTAAEYRRLLSRLPFKGQLTEITHDEFSRRLETFKARSERDHVLVGSKVFFNWCIKRRYITENPTFGLSVHKSASRARVLSDDELKAIWQACEQTAVELFHRGEAGQDGNSLPAHFCAIVKLLVVTGQRRGEIAALRSEYIKDGVCTLPKELTKNNREHAFPLSATASRIVESCTASRTNGGFLFPARGNQGACFSGWSKSKAALDKLSGVTGWTLHDLRRTFRSNLGRLGVSPHIAERLVNHVSAQSDMEQVYDRYTYLPEMRAAVEKYEQFLSAVLASK
jgi:integrase